MSIEDDYEDEDFEDASQDDDPAEMVGQEGQATYSVTLPCQDFARYEEDEAKADSSYGSEDFEEEQVSEELHEEAAEPSGGRQAPEVVVRAPSPAEAAPTGRESNYSDEAFEEQASEELEDKPLNPAAGAPAPELAEQASEELEDKPLNPAAGAPAPEVAVGASLPLEAKAEPEAVPSEPSIRSAEASPVSPGSDYGDEAFEEMHSEKLEDKAQNPLEGQPIPEATAHAPSTVEAVPSEPSIRSAEAALCWWRAGSDEMQSEKLEDNAQNPLEGQPIPEATAHAASTVEAKAEPELVPSEPSIRSAEASPRLPIERSSEHADEASPVQRSSDDGGYGSEDFEQDPEDKPGSGGPAFPGSVAKDVTESSDRPASSAGKYSDYGDEPFEEQLSAELPETLEPSGGLQVPEVVIHSPSPAEAAPTAREIDYSDDFVEEQASEELEDKPFEPAAGAPAPEVTVAASSPLEAEAELEAVPSEPSIRSAEASPGSPGSDYGDEAFEEMHSEKLEDKAQIPLEGQPIPEATAHAPASVEADWTEDLGFGQKPTWRSNCRRHRLTVQEQLSEELEESPMKSPGGPLAPEAMGRAPSPTEEAVFGVDVVGVKLMCCKSKKEVYVGSFAAC
eukprot:s5940_g2.t2